MMSGATNKDTTPTSPLIQSSDRNKLKRFDFHFKKSRWTVLLVFLFVLEVLGIVALILYCMQSYRCAKTVRHTLYNCENDITWLGHKVVMIVELISTSLEVVSRGIFLAFCFKSIRKRRQEREIPHGIWDVIRDICQRLVMLPKMWILAGLYILCVVRFVALLSDKPDLGSQKATATATIITYIVDALGITAVVAVLNNVTIQELANDNRDLCKITFYRTRFQRVVWYVFKFVLLCFISQFFLYTILAFVQGIYGVVEISQTSKGETKNDNVISVLKTCGQIVFMKQISSSLWAKWVDDGKRTIGERTDKQSTYSENNASESESTTKQSNYGENKAYQNYRDDLISTV